MEAFISLPVGQSPGHHHPAGIDMLHRPVMQRLHQFIPSLIIPARHDHHELVPANPVNRAVVKNVADHPACFTDVFIPGLVPQRVIDPFQAVDIAHRHGEGFVPPCGQIRVQFLFPDHKGMLALHAGHRINIGHGFALPGSPVHGPMVGQHHGQSKGKHADGHGDRADIRFFQLIHLILDVLLIRPPQSVGHGRVILMDIVHHPVVGGNHVLPHPYQGNEQHQRQQHHPDNGRGAETLFLVLFQNKAEKQKSQNAPDDKEQVGFRFQGAGGNQAGKHHGKPDKDHHRYAGVSRYLLRSVPPEPGSFGRCRGNKAVDQHRADDGDIHNPPDGRPARKGGDQGYRGNQLHGIGGHAMPVQLCKGLRQHPVLRLGIEKAAGRADVSDQAGKYQRQQRKHQDHGSRIAQIVLCGIEGREGLQPLQVAPVTDILHPGAVALRISRHGQQRYKNIQQGDGHNGRHQRPEHLAAMEGHLLRTVGYAFKTDKGPWRNHRNPDDLGQGIGIRRKSRRNGNLKPENGSRKRQRNARREEAGKDDHQRNGQAAFPGADEGKQQDRACRQQNFTQIYIISEQRV